MCMAESNWHTEKWMASQAFTQVVNDPLFVDRPQRKI